MSAARSTYGRRRSRRCKAGRSVRRRKSSSRPGDGVRRSPSYHGGRRGRGGSILKGAGFFLLSSASSVVGSSSSGALGTTTSQVEENHQMLPMNSRIVMLVTVLFAIFVTAGSAQVRTTGQIVGTVRDSTGAVIPEAEIQIRDLATGITAETRSARDGGFVFVAVQPGHYTLTAIAKGFQPVVIENLNVETSRATNLTIQCEVAGIQEQVQVQGQTTLIETSSTTISTTLGNAQIEKLPI